MMMRLERLKEPLLVPRWRVWKGLGGTFLATAYAICFRDPPCFSPAWHWLPTMLFLDGTERRLWTIWRAPRLSLSVCTQLSFLLSAKSYLGVLPIGSDMCLPLRTLCEHWGSFGCLASWSWRVSDVEAHLCWEVFVWDSAKCVGLCIGLPCWRVCDSSIFWCVGVYAICVIGILVAICKMGNSGSVH